MPILIPDLSILRHLATRTHATAAEIGISCRMTAAEVRSRLAGLESRRFVAGRHDARLVPPARAFTIISEGRRKVGTPN